MEFKEKELAALLKLGASMSTADGNIDENEIKFMEREIHNFNLDLVTLHKIIEDSKTLEPIEAITIMAKMLDEQKKYMCGFLATLMSIDGKLDENEIKLWKLVCSLTNTPTMNILEAIDFWTNN